MNTAPSACDLTRRDLMDMDALLMQELGKFIQCSHHALYFPTTHAPRQPELLPRERRLLLPLYRQGSLLGVLMLHGVKVRDARVLLPQLPAIADLCLELLARVKATRVDAVTGSTVRLFADGRNEHSLDIVEVRSSGDVVIDAAPRRFETLSRDNGAEPLIIDANYRAPLIFGKDSTTAQTLIYGHPLSPENQPETYNSFEREQEITRAALAKLNIRVPE